MKKPTAILAADWHSRGTRPKCRIDNFGDSITRKIKFIADLQARYDNIPTLNAGDLFHKSMTNKDIITINGINYNLLTWALMFFPDNMIVIPGQHDLPNHNIDLINQSNISVLAEAKKIKLRDGVANEWLDVNGSLINIEYFPFGKKLKQKNLRTDVDRNIAIVHDFIYEPDKDYFPGIEKIGSQAVNLLKKYDYDLIVSGDNHRTFVVKHENKLLVNPGSLYRSTTKQIDHKPCVFLWYAEDNTVEQVFIPIEDNIINNDYIVHEKQREDRIEKFADKLQNYDELDIDFITNINMYMSKNRQHSMVKQIINECVEI